jgi:hypothetical protein
MGRWSNARRAEEAAKAAALASEAGRTLQQRKQDAPKPAQTEPAASVDPPSGDQKPLPEASRPSLRNEPRRLGMEEILARDARTKGLAEQPAASEQTEQTVLEKPSQPTSAAEQPSPPPEPPADAPGTAPAAEPPKIETVRVKVDGEEFDVPKTEVEEAGGIPAYRIQRAAENRLKKANETLAEAKRIQAAAVEWAAQNMPKEPAKPQIPQDQFIAEKINVIRFGTPEEGAAAFMEVLQRANPHIDQNALMTQATTNAVTAMRRQSAVDAFKNEFSDVVANPYLYKLSGLLENERLTAIDRNSILTFDWNEFYRKIGNEVRTVAGRQSQPATAVPAASSTSGNPSPPSDREARKASIVTLPTAAARAELPKEEKPETREEMLNKMRKARGLPTS